MVLLMAQRNFSPLDLIWLGIVLEMEKKRKIYLMTIPIPNTHNLSVLKSKSLCKSGFRACCCRDSVFLATFLILISIQHFLVKGISLEWPMQLHSCLST